MDTRRARVGAVYLLIDNDVVVYIGQTTNLEQRIAWHVDQQAIPTITHWRTDEEVRNPDCKPFNRALALPLVEDQLRDVESALIRFFWPKFNYRAGAHIGRDNEILISLGLPPHDDERANFRAFQKHIYTPRERTVQRVATSPAKIARRLEAARTDQRERARRLFSSIEKLFGIHESNLSASPKNVTTASTDVTLAHAVLEAQ